jgi:hypothetical protein
VVFLVHLHIELSVGRAASRRGKSGRPGILRERREGEQKNRQHDLRHGDRSVQERLNG